MAFGCNTETWLIVSPNHSCDGRWRVCPPLRANGERIDPPLNGASFDTGAEAIAAFAGGGFPLIVDQLTEACRQYEWADRSGDRWFYADGDWHWETPFMARQTHCYDEAEVAKTYPWAGPFKRITGSGLPA